MLCYTIQYSLKSWRIYFSASGIPCYQVQIHISFLRSNLHPIAGRCAVLLSLLLLFVCLFVSFFSKTTFSTWEHYEGTIQPQITPGGLPRSHYDWIESSLSSLPSPASFTFPSCWSQDFQWASFQLKCSQGTWPPTSNNKISICEGW